MAEQVGVLVTKTFFGCYLMDLIVQGFIGVHWCDVHVKLGGIWMQVVFLG